jgi:hypothetical protein
VETIAKEKGDSIVNTHALTCAIQVNADHVWNKEFKSPAAVESQKWKYAAPIKNKPFYVERNAKNYLTAQNINATKTVMMGSVIRVAISILWPATAAKTNQLLTAPRKAIHATIYVVNH